MTGVHEWPFLRLSFPPLSQAQPPLSPLLLVFLVLVAVALVAVALRVLLNRSSRGSGGR